MLNGSYLDRLGVADDEPIPLAGSSAPFRTPPPSASAARRIRDDRGPVRVRRRSIEHADVVLDGAYLSEVEGDARGNRG